MMGATRIDSAMTIAELLRGFASVDDLPALEVTGLTADSRSVQPGELFIAMRGLSRHALDFAADAMQAGAIGVVFDAGDEHARQRAPLLRKQLGGYWIEVPDLQRVIGRIASRFHGEPSRAMQLVGITGTDGKTSVTHLLVQALMKLRQPVASIGTLGYGFANNLTMTGFTTPDALSLQSILAGFLRADCEYVIMEVSSHGLQQHRVSGCEFDVAVLTNLGSDHLDFHGSDEAYAAAKSQLFARDELRSRVLNLDDELGRQLAQRHSGIGITGYSMNTQPALDSAIYLVEQSLTETGLRMRVATPAGELDIQTDLIGAFNINNCLAVIGVLQSLGFAIRDIESAMQHLRPIPGRMEYFPAIDNQPAVVIDFAHTEQALRACLEALKDYTKGRICCVFGCGGDRDQSKRPRMAAVAEQLADLVFVTDDNPRNESPQQIMHDILTGFRRPDAVRVIHDRETAIRAAISQTGAHDLVVIAGKGHEPYQIVGDQRLVYSDHRVLRDIRAEVIA
jgi:UDP-N-acetylmuramoyl-L-alanyl-D-glutamate--2,6-diaminopimelate ligase